MSTSEQQKLFTVDDLDIEITSSDAIISCIEEALDLVDKAIKEISQRELVSVSEMTDLLLDVRLALVPLVS